MMNLIFCLLFSGLASATLERLGSDHSISKRTDSPDLPDDENIVHQIQCNAHFLSRIPQSAWPAPLDPRSYADLTAVCAYDSWNQYKLSCSCRAPYISDDVQCKPPPESFEPLYNSAFRVYCEAHCKCLVPKVVFEDPSDRTPLRQTGRGSVFEPRGRGGIGNSQRPLNPHAPKFNSRWRGGGRGRGRGRFNVLTIDGPVSLNQPGLLATTFPDSLEDITKMEAQRASTAYCHSACIGMTDCGGMTFGCVCLVDSPKSITSSLIGGETAFTSGHCGFMKKRKRSLDQSQHAELDLCACNSTYVSEACCASPDGLVVEDVSLKRGFLGLEEE